MLLTHSFRVLYYTNLVHLAEEVLPRSDVLAGVKSTSCPAELNIIPPHLRETAEDDKSDSDCSVHASSVDRPVACIESTQLSMDQCEEPFVAVDSTATSLDDGTERSVVRWANQRLDYQFRGAALNAWPLYFYIAGVSRLRINTTAEYSYLFDPQHPCYSIWKQVVRTRTPSFSASLIRRAAVSARRS